MLILVDVVVNVGGGAARSTEPSAQSWRLLMELEPHNLSSTIAARGWCNLLGHQHNCVVEMWLGLSELWLLFLGHWSRMVVRMQSAFENAQQWE